MIIEEYDESMFIARFKDYGREDNFSYSGLSALFEYIDELHDDENPFKMDVIALCCEFTEYENVAEFLKEQMTDLEKKDYDDDDDFFTALEEEINDNTTLIKLGDSLNDGFIIAGY